MTKTPSFKGVKNRLIFIRIMLIYNWTKPHMR